MESVENADFTEILEKNRLIIAQKLQVDRSFLFDYLRDKAVFDSEDCEFVHAEKTRERRVGKFLDILSLKGRDAYEHFIDAIQQLSPSLYETLTGLKAGLNPNRTEGNNILGSNGSLDLDIITSHLKRTMQDLQEMTLRYDQVLRDKQELNNNLKKTETELETQQKRVQELKRQRENTDELLSKAHGKAQRAEQGSANQVSSLHRDLNERNTYIIALQMRLLASQEGIDSLREKLGEVTVQRDELRSKLRSISRDYDNQRRESIKLSEKLAIQRDDIQKVEGMKLKVRELQFENQKLTSESEEAQKELNLLKDWTEALKARYDIVEEERRQTQYSHETVVADCSDLRDQSNELEIKLMIAKREIGDLSKRNADLEQSSSTIKEQRDFYVAARKEAIEERDQARRERDDAVQRHTEVLNKRDQVINQQMEHSKHFETQYETLLAELQSAREQLAKAELEVEELKRVEVDRVVSNVGDSASFVKPSRPNLHLQNPNRATNNKEATSFPNMSPSSSSQSSDESFDWKTHRKTKDLIDSLKKRVKSDGRNLSPSSSGSETLEPQLHSSLTLDEKLEELVPQMKTLSPRAKQCFSLDRNKIHIKSFDTLAWMFEGSVASTNSFPPHLDSHYCHSPKLSSETSDTSVPDPTCNSFESDAFEFPDGGQNSENKIAHSCELDESRHPTSPVKPPYVKSASSPPGMSDVKREEAPQPNDREKTEGDPRGNPNRRSLKDISNRPAYAIASSIYSFEYPSADVKDDWNAEEALMSPALRKPFRQRSGAKKFSEDERPRSASAPSESGSDRTSKEDNSLSSQSDSKEDRSVVEPESEPEHTHEKNCA